MGNLRRLVSQGFGFVESLDLESELAARLMTSVLFPRSSTWAITKESWSVEFRSRSRPRGCLLA
jgi:hypothetical protein